MKSREIAAGLGLGGLIGLLLGLSVSNVTGGVISALAALLAVFLGLAQPKADAGNAAAPDRSWRIAAFGFAAALAAIGGITIRAHDLLAPTVASEVQAWTDAGYAPADARSIVSRLRVGRAMPDESSAEGARKDNSNPAHGSVLYAEPGALSCTRLREDRFKSMEDWQAEMTSAGGVWKDFAAAATGVGAAQRKPMLESGYRLVCP
jgi:hypothetical protein